MPSLLAIAVLVSIVIADTSATALSSAPVAVRPVTLLAVPLTA